MNLREYLAQQQRLVDAELDRLVPPETTPPETIHRAMRYSLFAGGKRIRPILCIEAALTIAGECPGILAAACSLEMIHTYSLIHDDLPALDNDDYRRGKLTNHKVFGDAMAILAGDVAGSFETLAAAGGVKVSVEMPPDMPLVDVDPLRIQQVIGNLVANALRYAPRESTIAIGGETIPGSVRVSVTDHGSGVDPDLLPHIFDRFAKSEDSRGSGLGLAIARRLVEAHGGSIRAECPTDGGTRIAFDLPA